MFRFKSNQEFKIGNFNHCVSVNVHKGITSLAWYSASRECLDNQSVYLVNPKISMNAPIERVGDKTGNPIIFNHQGDTYLLFSKFEKPEGLGALRWQHCSLWIVRLVLGKNHHPLMVDASLMKIADASKHLLARCNPITMSNGSTIIPLYDEKYAKNVLMLLPKSYFESGRDDSPLFRELSGETQFPPCSMGFGVNCIQPTLFASNSDPEDQILYSLSRTFVPYGSQKPIREGETPSVYSMLHRLPLENRGLVSNSRSIDETETPLFNLNSSIHAVNWGDDIFIIWNRMKKRIRSNLSLGHISIDDGNVVLNSFVDLTKNFKGSYPSMFVYKNKLHFAYTNDSYKISYNVWNKKQYKSECQRGAVVS